MSWQDRVRDPSLTVLLVLQVFLLFVALPLDATGVPIDGAWVAWSLLLVVLTLVVVLSQRGVAIVIILLGLAAAAASLALGRQWPPITASVLWQRRVHPRVRGPDLGRGARRLMPPAASRSIVCKARSSCI